MNTPSLRLAAVLLAGLACQFLAPRVHAVGQSRAEYRNVSSSQTSPGNPTQNINPGVAFFDGYFNTPSNGVQTGTVVRLQECGFGQAFSQWYPSDTYGRDIIGVAGISGVKGVLYPNTSGASTRTTIENSGKPFRYKWLLYSGTGTDVTAFDATSIAGWFTSADRDAIAGQIAILKTAIAASPLDTSLRAMLLDVYYDLAVAEMQAAKPKLAELAKYHLGLLAITDNSKFIIDKEIDTYGEIATAIAAAIAQYAALFTAPFPDIDPSSFDPSVALGTIPMGRYVFIREQPRRNSTPSQYANENGISEVPQSVNGQVVTPGTLFTGYKDLNMLLQIIGQRQQHLASEARLRGTRQGGGDVATARDTLRKASRDDGTTLTLLKSWFPELFPVNYNALTQPARTQLELLLTQSGLLASLSAIESGQIEMGSVTAYLNGSANVLGYDPDFLLLVQDPTAANPPLESYDVLKDMLKGANKPLTDALSKLGTEVPQTGAKGLYLNFLEKVDRTAQDIDDADGALADRFFAITGFDPDESPGFDITLLAEPAEGQPDPPRIARPHSELRQVLKTIAALEAQAVLRRQNTAELDTQFKVGVDGVISGVANDAVTAANSKQAAVEAAAQGYRNTTGKLYQEMIGVSAGAAASGAIFDNAAASGGILTTAMTGNVVIGGVAGAVALTAVNVASAANIAMQTSAATITGQNERDIDYASIDFTVATGAPDARLAVSQAQQELSALKREQIANKLDILSDTAARAQAEAQRTGLLSELARIVRSRNASIASIRKKSYADPLHYHRAEYALIDADESFRTAQRWMFYTVQALNYKWHGRFAMTQGSKSYDTSTIFKCRNAQELDDLLTQMNQWDQTRVSQTTTSPLIYTKISLLEHKLAGNPWRTDPNVPADRGTRIDDTVDPQVTLTKLEYFRKELAKYKETGSGDLVIPINTAFRSEAPERVDGNFFRGATYNAQGDIVSLGFWREKIVQVWVNIVAEDGPVTNIDGTSSVTADLDYGGTVYFHTRVPPRGDRMKIPVRNPVTGLFDDYPGELMVAPFRYWVSPDFSQNFTPRSLQPVPLAAGYISVPGVVNGPGANLPVGVNDLAGRSIAATGWKLRLHRQTGSRIVDPAKIKDIELILSYRHSTRVEPN